MTPDPRPSATRSTVLHCTMIVYLVAGLLAASFGAVQPGAAWITQGAYVAAALVTLYGAVKGVRVLARDAGRRALIHRAQPLLYDMADYLGGHPSLPQRGRVLALLTADRLVLDASGRRVEVPLAATRLAERARADLPRRPWLVAHNRFGPRPADAVDVEFRDERGAAHRLTLARFRRTAAVDWTAALAAAAAAAVPCSSQQKSAPVK